MRELVLINAVARALALFSGVSSAEKRHVEIAKRLLSQNGGPLYGRRPPDPKLETLIA
jgi:hypothetical protein